MDEIIGRGGLCDSEYFEKIDINLNKFERKIVFNDEVNIKKFIQFNTLRKSDFL